MVRCNLSQILPILLIFFTNFAHFTHIERVLTIYLYDRDVVKGQNQTDFLILIFYRFFQGIPLIRERSKSGYVVTSGGRNVQILGRRVKGEAGQR